VTCEFSNYQQVVFNFIFNENGGGFAAQFSALDHLNNGQVVDKTQIATWTSHDPTIMEVIGQGQYNYLKYGQVNTINASFDIWVTQCTYCEQVPININWKSAAAITYGNWDGTEQEGVPDEYHTTCGQTQVGACTPDTMPVLAPQLSQVIQHAYECNLPPQGQQWQTISVCNGFGSLGPFCYPVHGVISGLSTTPKACTPLSVWPK
jgi:hypothetical protein